MVASIKERVLAYKGAAAEQLALIREQDPLSKAFLSEHLFIYVKRKYLLDDGECCSDKFSELLELSIAKSTGISKNLVTELDSPAGCDGTTSAVTKKVLLLMIIQQDFDVRLPPERTGLIKTVADLAGLLWAVMSESEFWKPRLLREIAF